MDETEKNLNRVLDMTERNGMILFCNETEALFCKRCQVAGSHDRYADAGVAHLLERIENPQITDDPHDGKRRLDQAFSPQKPAVVMDGRMKTTPKKKE